MMNAWSVFSDGFAMSFGRIPLIGDPLIVRILLVQVSHIFVAMCLGQNAGSCNGHILPISFDDTAVANVRMLDKILAIDQ